MAEILNTAERIKHKAKELFMQFGLKSVSMDDIANGLGISKKTIYLFYADKDALVDDVIASLIQHNQECCDQDQKTADNAVHEIFLAMDFIMEVFRSMNPSLLFDMQKYYPAAYQKFSKHKNDYLYGVIKSNLERGMAEEWYRSDLKVDVMARFRVESMMLPFNPEFHTKVKLNLAAIEEEITLHFLFGMVSPKGYKLAVKYHQDRIKKAQL
ncbi:MAG: TetR/AcrR family transcriptional regulator [Ferruginibacter sp.]|nr:TetR/AcrR family transcriptional regulator [Ferruginibacter sp.]